MTIETHTLEVPGAELAYDIRPAAGNGHRPLLLIGSPMGAAGFETLSGHFTDRTVITYDPRGSERSKKDDPGSPVDPDLHAEDLKAVIEAAGLGPVDLFASSGGAVNALALVAKYPDLVSTLVAHEPPLVSILPDREAAMAATRAVAETYQQKGMGAGMAHFIAVSSHNGLFDAEWAAEPGPDPAMFGLPTGDDGSRDDPLLGQNLITCTFYVPDRDALTAASTRIVVAAGEESGETLAARGARAVAGLPGTEGVTFPSHHGGFLGGEYGQTGDPDAFGARLREVLDGSQ